MDEFQEVNFMNMSKEGQKEYLEMLNTTCNKLDHKNLCDGFCHKCTIHKAISIILSDSKEA